MKSRYSVPTATTKEWRVCNMEKIQKRKLNIGDIIVKHDRNPEDWKREIFEWAIDENGKVRYFYKDGFSCGACSQDHLLAWGHKYEV